MQIDYAQIVDKNGKAIGNPGQGPPTLGFGWNPTTELNPFHLVRRARPRRTSDEIVIDKDRPTRRSFKVGDEVEDPHAKRAEDVHASSASRSSATPTASRARRPRCSRCPRRSGSPTPTDQFSTDLGRRRRRACRKTQVADEHRAGADGATARASYEVITGKAITKENQDVVHKTSSASSTSFLLIFALVALIVGSFIIYNTFSIVVAQRTREMALLRAIGASRGARCIAPGARRVGRRRPHRVGHRHRRAASCSRSGSRRAMSAVGFDLPGSEHRASRRTRS